MFRHLPVTDDRTLLAYAQKLRHALVHAYTIEDALNVGLGIAPIMAEIPPEQLAEIEKYVRVDRGFKVKGKDETADRFLADAGGAIPLDATKKASGFISNLHSHGSFTMETGKHYEAPGTSNLALLFAKAKTNKRAREHYLSVMVATIVGPHFNRLSGFLHDMGVKEDCYLVGTTSEIYSSTEDTQIDHYHIDGIGTTTDTIKDHSLDTPILSYEDKDNYEETNLLLRVLGFSSFGTRIWMISPEDVPSYKTFTQTIAQEKDRLTDEDEDPEQGGIFQRRVEEFCRATGTGELIDLRPGQIAILPGFVPHVRPHRPDCNALRIRIDADLHIGKNFNLVGV